LLGSRLLPLAMCSMAADLKFDRNRDDGGNQQKVTDPAECASADFSKHPQNKQKRRKKTYNIIQLPSFSEHDSDPI